MLTVSSSSFPPVTRGQIFCHGRSSSSDLYRPRTIIIEKPTSTASYGFSIQTYGIASLNLSSSDESAYSFASLSSESATSRKSSASTSFCSTSQGAPIQLVTYVDQVQDRSPAWEAGLRAGSVIISVNDKSVENDDHETLVLRITETSTTLLKLVIVQQNINKQITLCEKLQQLQKELHEKEEEFEDLCKQEMNNEEDVLVKETQSPLPLLQHLKVTTVQRESSFCHDKIPLDWRQSVANFANQQNSIVRTIPSSKYVKNRQLNPSQHYQRSMSLSTIVFNCSKSTLRRRHSLIQNFQSKSHRRSLSHDELCSPSHNKHDLVFVNHRIDDSMIESGCSLAMDLSRSTDRKTSVSSSSSSSSSTTLNTLAHENSQKEKNDNKIKHFKWKLRINK